MIRTAIIYQATCPRGLTNDSRKERTPEVLENAEETMKAGISALAAEIAANPRERSIPCRLSSGLKIYTGVATNQVRKKVSNLFPGVPLLGSG